MKKTPLLLIIIFVSLNSFCQTQLSDSQKNDITTFIKKTMQELEIPGVAVAVIKDNKVVYKNYIGKANLEYNIPITDTSLFRLHSLSKIFVSTGIFQLIDQNKISLDDDISKYLDDLPETWKSIKIKHLLSHSSGLPDMREETNPSEEIAKTNVYGKDIQFTAGEKASYNQTNFWLLNRIIRKIANGDFQNHITNQFGKTSKVCFSNVLDIIPNRVMEYKPNKRGQLKNFHFVVQDYLYGAGGLTLTLDDLIEWDKKLNNNLLISELSKNKMFTPFKYKTGKGFSYGWDIQHLNGIVSYGFNGGGLVNYRKFPSKNISILWFTNGYRKPHNIDNVTNRILGYIDDDLLDKTPKFAQLMYELVSSNTSNQINEEYYKLKKQYPYVNFESVLNALGYNFINKGKTNEAISVFKLNTEDFHNSANAFDSLGEAYYINKQYDLALKYYKRAIELGGTNGNAKKMIAKINKGEN